MKDLADSSFDYMGENITFQAGAIISTLFLHALLIIFMFILAYQCDSPEKSKKSSIIAKILSVGLHF